MPTSKKITARKTKKNHNQADRGLNQPAHLLLDRIICAHLCLMVLLIPLAFWLDTETIFTLPKLLVLRTLTWSSGLLILYKFFLAREIKMHFPRRTIFLLFWLGSMILSTIFSINPLTSLFGQYGRFMGLFTFIYLMLIPVYLANFYPKEKFNRLVGLSCVTAGLVSLYGLLQYFNFFGLWQPPFEWTDSPQNRVFSTMGHANHLAAYLAAHLIILVYSLTWNDFRKHKLLLTVKVLDMLLIALIIVLTASRGAVLALVLSTLVLVVIRTWKYFSSLRHRLGRKLIAVLAILILSSAGYFFFAEQFSELSLVKRTEQTIHTTQKGIIPDRLSFLYSAWDMFLDNPVLGTGLSTFRDAYSAYRRTDYHIDGPGHAEYITVPESAHNEYANTLATQGLVGMLTYLALLAAVFHLLGKKYFQASAQRENYYLGIMGALLVFCFQTLFNFAEIVNWTGFFFLIGLIMSEEDHPFRIRIRWPALVWYPLMTVMVLLTVAVLKLNIIDVVQADYYFHQAKLAQVTQKSQLADRYFQVAIANRPWEYLFYQTYGDFSVEAAFWTNLSPDKGQKAYLLQAVENYRLAEKYNSNYPSTSHNLALAYLQLYRLTGNTEYGNLSKKYYQLSVDKSPNNPRYLYEYARKLHSDWNDREGAVKLLRQAIAMAPEYQEPRDYLEFLYKNHPELQLI
jgi:putative inorganic carbon (HCO3(-)) transporter